LTRSRGASYIAPKVAARWDAAEWLAKTNLTDIINASDRSLLEAQAPSEL
jgi:hypothetical protein